MVSLHVTYICNNIILMHNVLLPPITSVHLVATESPCNYIHVYAMRMANILELSLHYVLEEKASSK